MEIDSIPTNPEETEQIDSFDATRPLDLLPNVSASALEEGQIPDSSPQPPSESSGATPQTLDKGKEKAVEDDWATVQQVTAVITDDQDRRDDWGSGWGNNDRAASPAALQATATTTKKTTNVAWANSVQSVAEKSSSGGWGSWGTNSGWGSPIPARTAGAGEWGDVPPAAAPAPGSTTTPTTASTSTWGSTSTTNYARFEDRSEGGLERGRGRGKGHGRGRGRGRDRDRDWGDLGGFGKRDEPYLRDQPPNKSFNQPVTSFSNPDSGWGARSGRNNWTNETSTTRRYQQEVQLAGSNCPLLRADLQG